MKDHYHPFYDSKTPTLWYSPTLPVPPEPAIPQPVFSHCLAGRGEESNELYDKYKHVYY